MPSAVAFGAALSVGAVRAGFRRARGLSDGSENRPLIHAEFGTHLDVVNMITSPRRYFFNDEFLRECFEKLHGTIVSCHLNDILLKPEYTFQLQECACGEGTLDIKLYAQLATAENPHMPMIIEHLTTDEEYVASVQYVRERLAASTSAAVPE